MNIKQIFDSVRSLDAQIRESGLNKPDLPNNLSELCEVILVSPEVIKGCLKLYKQNHNSLAVETAYKAINNYVKSRSGLTNMDGVPLMQTAFSPTNPKIKLNKLETTSEKDEQLGYMNIFAGSMAGIRNPRAHEHEIKDSERTAFELLILADHLFQKLKNSVH